MGGGLPDVGLRCFRTCPLGQGPPRRTRAAPPAPAACGLCARALRTCAAGRARGEARSLRGAGAGRGRPDLLGDLSVPLLLLLDVTCTHAQDTKRPHGDPLGRSHVPAVTHQASACCTPLVATVLGSRRGRRGPSLLLRQRAPSSARVACSGPCAFPRCTRAHPPNPTAPPLRGTGVPPFTGTKRSALPPPAPANLSFSSCYEICDNPYTKISLPRRTFRNRRGPWKAGMLLET